MLLNHQATKVVITGKSGSGKTTYFERLVRHGFNNPWRTIFIYDWQGEMSQRIGLPPVDRSEHLADALKTGFVCYDPGEEWPGEPETGFDFFCAWVFETRQAIVNDEVRRGLAPSSCLFACDELQQLVGNNMPWEFKCIIQTGRRWGIDSAIVSQQLNEIPNTLRNQCTEVVTFQHSDPYVLGVMDTWGFDPDQVNGLAIGEYLWRDDRGGLLVKKLFDTPRNANTLQTPASDGNRQETEAGPDAGEPSE